MMATVPNDHDAIFATRTGNWLSLKNINTRLRDSILKDNDIGTWFELRLLRSATGSVVANGFGAEAAECGGADAFGGRLDDLDRGLAGDARGPGGDIGDGVRGRVEAVGRADHESDRLGFDLRDTARHR